MEWKYIAVAIPLGSEAIDLCISNGSFLSFARFGKGHETRWKPMLTGPLNSEDRTDLWSLRRIAEVIRKRFGTTYHPNHVWRLLVRMGWSCQKPERRALQRNEEGIEHWKWQRRPYSK
jgi:transposase